jgi:hypothetical protein
MKMVGLISFDGWAAALLVIYANWNSLLNERFRVRCATD